MSIVVVAPDKFKGSLTAGQVASHLARGLQEWGVPASGLRLVPMADGGEGTVDAAVAAGWARHRDQVPGPLADPVTADYAIAPGGQDAVVELAQASGLALTRADPASARAATSYGTGTLIRHALDHGVARIVLAVGGSACNDGGAGMMQALGARLLDDAGQELAPGGDALRSLARVDLTGLDPRLATTPVVLAADVDNPLLGQHGAIAVYSRQKGADAPARTDLEEGLQRWAEVVTGELPATAAAKDQAGAGAAGGVGFAALALLGAQRRSGIETVIEMTGLREQLTGADLAITGEGSLDEQSLYGKTPVGVAAAAREAGVPTVAVAGRTSLSDAQLAEHGISACYPLTDVAAGLAEAIRHAGTLVEQLGATIAEDHLSNR